MGAGTDISRPQGPSPEPTVTLIAPDGSRRTMTRSQAQPYIAKGAKVAR
jgi:hypothetical protein